MWVIFVIISYNIYMPIQSPSIFSTKVVDLIAIFWEWHKVQLDSGRLEFAYQDDYFESGIYSLEKSLRATPLNTYPVIERFGVKAMHSIRASVCSFINLQTGGNINDFYRDEAEPLNPDLRFKSSYIQDLIEFIDENGRVSFKLVNNPNTEGALRSGFHTAFVATSQMAAIFAAELQHTDATKVALTGDLGTVLAYMGIDFGQPQLRPSYRLFNAKGVVDKRLSFAREGDYTGCPAARVMSDEARSFLNGIDITPRTRVVVEDFSRVVGENLHTLVRAPYLRLSEWEKKLISSEDQRILDGEILAAFKNGEIPRCHRDKEMG